MSISDILSIENQEKIYQRIIQYSVEPTVLHLDYKIIYINDSGAKLLKGTKDQLVGSILLDVFTDDVKPLIKKRIKQVIDKNEPADLVEQKIIKMDGTTVEVLISCHPVVYGDHVVIQTVFRDITKQKDIEAENAILLKEIHAYSTPLVPITKGICVLPLIGEINKKRRDLLIDTVPMKIAGTELDYLIVDFSGIYNFDQVVVECLSTLHKIVKMLGVQMIVTGIRPELAISAQSFGEDLLKIRTAPTVMHALHLLGVK